MIAFAAFISAQASIVVVNGLSHEHKLAGTAAVQGNIVVRNTGDKTKRARIYKTDVIHNCKGETEFDLNLDRGRCNAKWLTISDNEILMTAGQTVNITYSMKPETGVEQVGSYWGVIMVEEVEDLDTSLPTVGVKVNALVRYAIQIIGSYEAGAIKQLEFQGLKLDTTEGSKILKIGINNTGNLMMKPIVILELYDAGGNQVARKELPYQKVYPGYCKLFELPMGDIPAGTYSGVLVADCGDESIFGLEVQLDVPELNQ